jgi:hypothetical protein
MPPHQKAVHANYDYLFLDADFLPAPFERERVDLLLEADFFEVRLVLDARFDVLFFDAPLFDALFFDALFFLGTFAPDFRASDKPIAIACLRLFTVFPDLPDLSFPRFFSCIALSTFF